MPKGLYKRTPRYGVKSGVMPQVRFLFDTMAEEGVTAKEVAFRAGIGEDTLKDWRLRSGPRLSMIEAALNVMGWTLSPKPLEDKVNAENKNDRVKMISYREFGLNTADVEIRLTIPELFAIKLGVENTNPGAGLLTAPQRSDLLERINEAIAAYHEWKETH